MKRKLLLSIALLLASGLFQLAPAQEAELELYTRVTTAIENNEPEWKLDRKAVLPSQLIIRWASEKGRVLVAIARFASEADATDALNARVEEQEHSPESKVSKKELKDFGSTGYILRNGDESRTTILFRKGDYIVQVYGPTEDVARRFSRHVADLLPPSHTPNKA
jgi:hypothetical protein